MLANGLCKKHSTSPHYVYLHFAGHSTLLTNNILSKYIS